MNWLLSYRSGTVAFASNKEICRGRRSSQASGQYILSHQSDTLLLLPKTAHSYPYLPGMGATVGCGIIPTTGPVQTRLFWSNLDGVRAPAFDATTSLLPQFLSKRRWIKSVVAKAFVRVHSDKGPVDPGAPSEP